MKKIIQNILFGSLGVLIIVLIFIIGESIFINGFNNNADSRRPIGSDSPLKLTANKVQNQELFEASHQGKTKRVMDMLNKYRFDTNYRDNNGKTALMIATENNKIDVAKSLIEGGYSVNAKDNTGNTPYLHAAARGYTDILKLAIPQVPMFVLLIVLAQQG